MCGKKTGDEEDEREKQLVKDWYLMIDEIIKVKKEIQS